ncbi:MAG: formate dehydrogenase accessory sulfurtransferase FdhD [Candidatus Cloacimonetes bacterium]|nr:formate dehydrogenase accessory sulfurtransferase FdhD [Candidatus Cloacimonadota bacterium]
MDETRTLTEIKRFVNTKSEMLTDIVARERSFSIFVNGKRLLSISVLPENLRELAWGFLFSEGIIQDKEEILSENYTLGDSFINFKLNIPQERLFNFFNTGEKTSGCGSFLSSALSVEREKFPKIIVNSAELLKHMVEFQKDSQLFRETGGVHSAALVLDNRIISRADDIGRHNAVDKIIGDSILKAIDLSKTILLSSGRISSEIVKKCVRSGIPIIASQSAPTSEAIRLGWDYKIFIIGFMRGKRFNLYTGFDDLVFPRIF